MEISFMNSMLTEVCEKNGLVFSPGPVSGVSGEIISLTKNKQTHFFNCCFDINPYGSSILARNKGLTRVFLKQYNISMPQGFYFSKNMSDYQHLSNQVFIDKIQHRCHSSLTLPLMIKGADIHRGACVFKVDKWEDFAQATNKVLKMTDEIVVEEYIPYNTYRILVYNDKVIACYGKEPFYIIGDGTSTVESLINSRIKYVNEFSIGMSIESILADIYEHLEQHGYSMSSIIPSERKIYLTDTASISKGGIAEDFTFSLGNHAKQYAIKIAKHLNLSLCGIDVVCKDISNAPDDCFVLEVNSSPCLETFATLGEHQKLCIFQLMETIVLDSLGL